MTLHWKLNPQPEAGIYKTTSKPTSAEPHSEASLMTSKALPKTSNSQLHMSSPLSSRLPNLRLSRGILHSQWVQKVHELIIMIRSRSADYSPRVVFTPAHCKVSSVAVLLHQHQFINDRLMFVDLAVAASFG